ncbi:hypothetical protein Rsub_12891 [Raphidocelis subcapitata]|uniref:Uncharacterized protein n=1 Tax=Raphidocelis subcapitata TaxID=307507 RepID=A0A2V0PKK6_9CHLO|nr:hypothetical protein Rsub_12891 [Raphidocelis subcapitata]|eukprot:GBG00247.1 hypothetical protein Rsub_12891 [Raphidocelis subcapitata]
MGLGSARYALVLAPLLLLLGIRSANGYSTVLTFQLDSGLQKRSYAMWIIGWSPASKKYLDHDPQGVGFWKSIPSGSGHIGAKRLGKGQGELSQIKVESANPVIGGRLYVVLVPVGEAASIPPPCVTYTNGGADIVQPLDAGTEPNANTWLCNNQRFMHQVIEVTQPSSAPMTINLQVVDGFVFPITITLTPAPGDGITPGQIGQPLTATGKAPNNINRQSIFKLYNNFIKREALSDAMKTAYLDLIAKSGVTPGRGGEQLSNGILSPRTFLASATAANQNSGLLSQFDSTLQELFKPGNIIGMRSDDNRFYKGTATQDGGAQYIDFVAFDQPGCQAPNPGYHYRVYSPLTPDPTSKPKGTPAYMVFGNVGVFDDVSSDAVLAGNSGIAQALQRDIAAALNRGVALLHEAPSAPNTLGCNADHSRYWAESTHWYPINQTYNNYARFMHVARFDANQPLYVPAPNAVKDAQNMTMGQSYGFPFDETLNGDRLQPNCPSKFDPVPVATSGATILIGTFGR